MKILIALKTAADLEIMEELLHAEGHEVILVSDGNAALEALQENPDLIVMDAELPGKSGYECCMLIKQDEKNRYKPVVLVMPAEDSTAWARFTLCGADDFVEHPTHPHAIKAKIKLLLHIKELYQRLDTTHHNTEQEIRLAKHMFDSITKREKQEFDFVHFWGLSTGHFCGDLFIMERTPENHLHLFLGDFTGHGLAAAMGALPSSAIFFAMTRKGCGISDIAEEMNRKLYEILPTGKFCSAVFLRLEADNSKLEIWNGGLPSVLLVNNKCKIGKKLESFHLPLGISEPTKFNSQTKTIELLDYKSVLLYSDGLIEARNSNGECYGEKRLIKELGKKGKQCCSFNEIKTGVLSFLEGLEPLDDISLAVLQLEQE